jgi:hypothetical protein
MDPQHNPDDPTDVRRSVMPPVAENAPDPVETRDPRNAPVPATRGRAWLYAIPAALLLVIGLVWMVRVERARPGQNAPAEVTGTSGERANDPEGGGRGDEKPLNPAASGPSVISDMELLTSKSELVGRAVRFAAIPVVTASGPRTFWVGRLGNQTLVLMDDKVQGATNVVAGTAIQLSGTLEPAPSDRNLASAGLDDADRRAIEGEKVIIRAKSLKTSADSGANQATVPTSERQ